LDSCVGFGVCASRRAVHGTAYIGCIVGIVAFIVV
jgi:hypothetical protein